MSKVLLVVIYNHKFESNIRKVELIYSQRFSEIVHLVPFYSGHQQNVIPVYENSYYFQGYIAQSIKNIYDEKFEHYFFIGDDLILNPIINENNYKEHLKLTDDSSFIPEIISLHKMTNYWSGVKYAYDFNIKSAGVEVVNDLPNKEVALLIFKKFNLDFKSLKFSQIWKTPKTFREVASKIKHDRFYFIRFLINIVLNKKYNLSYPLVGSYSDIFVVSSSSVKDFSHYCGVFASLRLFVEIGLPSSLVLSSNKIITEKDLKLQGKAFWPDGWSRLTGKFEIVKNDFVELNKYDDVEKLLNTFPNKYLYIHPIKLSKWKI